MITDVIKVGNLDGENKAPKRSADFTPIKLPSARTGAEIIMEKIANSEPVDSIKSHLRNAEYPLEVKHIYAMIAETVFNNHTIPEKLEILSEIEDYLIRASQKKINLISLSVENEEKSVARARECLTTYAILDKITNSVHLINEGCTTEHQKSFEMFQLRQQILEVYQEANLPLKISPS